jgi:hypothetical protein
MTRSSSAARAVRAATASVPGLSHVVSGTVRQDATRAIAVPGGGFVIAVADGHGDKTYRDSHLGAMFAVEVACEVFGALAQQTAEGHPISDERLKQAARNTIFHWRIRCAEFDALRRRWTPAALPTTPTGEALETSPDRFAEHLRDLWQELQALREQDPDAQSFKTFGSTLLVAMVTEHDLVFMRLGDGQMILVPRIGDPQLILADATAKAFGNTTDSLASSGVDSEDRGVAERALFKRIRRSAVDPVLVALVTDGVSDPYIPVDEQNARENKPAESARIWGERQRHEIEAHGLQAWAATLGAKLAKAAATSGDDASAAFLYFEGHPAIAEKDQWLPADGEPSGPGTTPVFSHRPGAD